MGQMSEEFHRDALPGSEGGVAPASCTNSSSALPPPLDAQLWCTFERGPTILELVLSVPPMPWVVSLPEGVPVVSSWALELRPVRVVPVGEVAYFTDGSLRHGEDESGARAIVKVATDEEGVSYPGAWAAPFNTSFLASRVRGCLGSTDIECAAVAWALMAVISDPEHPPTTIHTDSLNACNYIDGGASVRDDNVIARMMQIIHGIAVSVARSRWPDLGK
eukprot:5554264-Pyramimonas_sp.AAC.1